MRELRDTFIDGIECSSQASPNILSLHTDDAIVDASEGENQGEPNKSVSEGDTCVKESSTSKRVRFVDELGKVKVTHPENDDLDVQYIITEEPGRRSGRTR